jgi:thiol-disulfide isomerase/thioredoxin
MKDFIPHKFFIFYIFPLVFYITSCTPHNDNIKNLSGIRHIENFALLDHLGKFHELYYYSDMKAVVLVSQENDCPINQKSFPYLEALKKKYEPLGVVFLMINANPQDDRESINQEAKAYGVDIPILEDKAQVVTEGLGIKRTAQALLINPHNWSIIYQGAINDQFGYETQKIVSKRDYLEDAINAVLVNNPVLLPLTSVNGCLINFEAQNDKPPTYIHDIAPILINKCIICHSRGQIAPWSMDNYEKVRSHGSMIREVLRVKRMPPWGVDPFYSKLKHEMSLTSQQTGLIIHWVEQGMNRGDGADPLLTVARPPSDGWPLGKPDLIISLKDEQSIPAAGLLNYRAVQGNTSIDQDRWVKAIYWKPGNRKVLHHAHLLVKSASPTEHQDWFSDSGWYYDLGMIPTQKNYHLIDNFSPGTSPLLLSDDTGMFLPKGTRFIFALHYTVTGKPETDNTQVGLYFHKNKPDKILSIYYYYNTSLIIPARVKEFNVAGIVPIKNSITLYAIKPHMHARGRSMKVIAHYPDGSSEIILSVPNYKFNWQPRYYFDKPLRLPAGTNLSIQASFDNSSQNPDNPDPERIVRWGNFTSDEMMVAVLYYVRETSFKFPRQVK